MKNVRLKKEFMVPMYDVGVLVVVAEDASRAWRRYKKFYDGEKDAEFKALCCSKDGAFALFFGLEWVSDEVIAHEIKHLVDFLMEFVGEDDGAAERPAYLTGFLHKQVYKILRQGRVRLVRKRKSAKRK